MSSKRSIKKSEKEVYSINSEIGNGSFGRVYNASFNGTNCAIKKVWKQGQIEKIKKEIDFLKTLESNFVMPYRDHWTDDDFIYIEMELGFEDLKKHLSNKKDHFQRKVNDKMNKYEVFISFYILCQLLEGLNYLHKFSPPVIHRDVKPANIVITDGHNGNHLKFCDFGLSIFHENSFESHTSRKGSLFYMAPEVLNGGKYNTSADIYSLSIIALEIIGFQFEEYRNRGDDKEKRVDWEDWFKKHNDVNNINEVFNDLFKELRKIILAPNPRDRSTCSSLLNLISKTLDRICPNLVLRKLISYSYFDNYIDGKNYTQYFDKFDEFITIPGKHLKETKPSQTPGFLSRTISRIDSNIRKSNLFGWAFTKKFENFQENIDDKGLSEVTKIKDETDDKEYVLFRINMKDVHAKVLLDFHPIADLNVENLQHYKSWTENGHLFVKMKIVPVEKKEEIEQNDNIMPNKENFKMIEKIGHGGFGMVFKSSFGSDGSEKAVKIIALSDKNQAEMVLREIEILSTLRTDHVVGYQKAWVDEHSIYIQMELCSDNLHNILSNRETIFPNNTQPMNRIEYYIWCQILIEILEAVNYLHKYSPPIIHRDLKPANILFDNKGQNNIFFKLCDFGLAKFHDQSTHTRNLGTSGYMAPEIKRDGTRYNHKSDIFGLGVIASELFNIDLARKQIQSDHSLYERFKRLQEIIESMTSADHKSRPDCSDVLDMRDEWTQSLTDVQELTQLYDQMISKLRDNTLNQESLAIYSRYHLK